MSETVAKFLFYFDAAKHGAILSFQTIWQWIITYGLPLIEMILPILLPIIGKGKLTPELVTWVENALHAEQAGTMTIQQIVQALMAYETNGTPLPALS